MVQEVEHGAGDILGCQLPIIAGSWLRVTELGLHAAWQDGRDADSERSEIQHAGFGQADQAELAGVLGRASGEGILAGE